MWRRLGVAGLALALLAPTALAWEQFHGGPGRRGETDLRVGVLDVVGNASLPGEPRVMTHMSTAAAQTPHGLVLLGYGSGSCQLFLVRDPARMEVSTNDVEGCQGGRLVGYDAARDVVLMCVWGGPNDPVLQARRPLTAEVAWSVVPSRDLGLVVAPSSARWSCSGAIDGEAGEAVLAFDSYDAGSTNPLNRVAAVDLATGQVRWTNTVRTAFSAVGAANTLREGSLADSFHPYTVTLTSTGVLVVGWVFPCGHCVQKGDEAFLAWFTREGSFRGMERTKLGSPTDTTSTYASRTHTVSSYAMASGTLAAAALGGRIVLVNPEAAEPVARAPLAAVEPVTSSLFWPAGVATRDLFVVALPHSLSAFEDTNLAPRWSWGEAFDTEVGDVVATTGGDLHVLTHRPDAGDVALVRLDAATGDVLSRTPLPQIGGYRPGQGASFLFDNGDHWDAELVPSNGTRLVLVDNRGHLVTLGAHPPGFAPGVEPSVEFPRSGETLRLVLSPPPGAEATRYVVSWGDGSFGEVEPGEAPEHAYAKGGRHAVQVTAVLPDGRTASRVLALDVDGTPPEPRSFLQEAFSPERENLTFGVLGIALTLLGGILTFGRSRRRRSRLERELATLDQVRVLGERDPASAARALVAYREKLPSELGRGRIDDGQYGVLELRALRLLKLLRTRVVAPVETRLTPRFARLVDSAFEDGVLHAAECRNLLHALALEAKLTAEERERVADFLKACVHEAHGAGELAYPPT